jgi:hypothetical protein
LLSAKVRDQKGWSVRKEESLESFFPFLLLEQERLELA